MFFIFGLGALTHYVVHDCPECTKCKDCNNSLIKANKTISYANYLLRDGNVIVISNNNKPQPKQMYGKQDTTRAE